MVNISVSRVWAEQLFSELKLIKKKNYLG